MEIQGLNDAQRAIADLLWNCEDGYEVDDVIEAIGTEAQVVYQMMMAAHFDTVDDPLDPEILERIARKH
jgi:hypothetical protein